MSEPTITVTLSREEVERAAMALKAVDLECGVQAKLRAALAIQPERYTREEVAERLSSDEAKEAVAEALRDTEFTVVLDAKLEKLPSYGGEITWPELAHVALRAALSAAFPDQQPVEAVEAVSVEARALRDLLEAGDA